MFVSGLRCSLPFFGKRTVLYPEIRSFIFVFVVKTPCFEMVVVTDYRVFFVFDPCSLAEYEVGIFGLRKL